MPEENNSSPSDAQRVLDGTPQRGTPNEDAASQRDTAGDEIRDPEKKRLHEEAVSHKRRAKELEAQLKAYQDKEQQAKDAQLPEIERLKKQVSDSEQVHAGLIEQLVDREVRLQAAELGVPPQNLKYVAKLIWDDLAFDQDTGMPTNVGSLLKDLLKELDLTGKRATSAGGATNPSRAQSNGSQITEHYVNDLLSGRLPQGTYEALSAGQRNEVQAILSKHRKY